MRVRRLDDSEGRRTFAVALDAGEEVADGLLAFAREQELRGAHMTGIGALQEVTLGFWDANAKQYREIPLHEQVEVLSLVGNVALAPDGGPKVHAHIVVGKSDGTAHGGHLLAGRVRPTLEIIVTESPRHLQRRIDPETQLALLAP